MAKHNKARACVVIKKYDGDDDMMRVMMMTIKAAMVRPKKARACKRFLVFDDYDAILKQHNGQTRKLQMFGCPWYRYDDH